MSVIPGAAVVVDEASVEAAIKALLEDFDRKQNLIQQLFNDSSKERYSNNVCNTTTIIIIVVVNS